MRRAPLKSLLNPWTALILALLVANIAVFAVWTLPRWNARRGISGATTEIRDARQRIEPRLQAARETYGRVVRAEDELRTFRTEMVADFGASELMALLREAGNDAGIAVDDATYQLVPIPELGVIQLGINLPVVGSYEAVRALIDELISLPVFLVVDGIGLQAVAVAGAPPGVAKTARVELAFSVFIEDPDLAGASATADVRAQPARSSAQEVRLLAATRGDDPEELAEALVERLDSLPPLPVDPAALVLRLDRLVDPTFSAEPRRNLFSIVLPPPPVSTVDEEEAVFVEPEPTLPVRLLGITRVEGRWHASLTDGVALFVAEAGDSLPIGVEVLEVGPDYADVMFGDERTRLTLEGNER